MKTLTVLEAFLSHNTSVKIQTQGLTIKKSKQKKFKAKKLKPVDKKSSILFCFDNFAKHSYQDKKKKWLKKKDFTLATGNNAIEGKKKQNPDNAK